MDDFRRIRDRGELDSLDEFLCPSNKISKNPDNISENGILTSYGYNPTDWPGTRIKTSNVRVGHRVETIKSLAEKLAFVYGIDWWVDWNGAHYEMVRDMPR